MTMLMILPSLITIKGRNHMLPKYRPPTHPGEMLLKEFLEPLDITQMEFSRHLSWPYARLNEIIKGKRGVSAASALDLGERYSDTNAEGQTRRCSRSIQGRDLQSLRLMFEGSVLGRTRLFVTPFDRLFKHVRCGLQLPASDTSRRYGDACGSPCSTAAGRQPVCKVSHWT